MHLDNQGSFKSDTKDASSKLAQLNARRTCNACGKIGRWANDAACLWPPRQSHDPLEPGRALAAAPTRDRPHVDSYVVLASLPCSILGLPLHLDHSDVDEPLRIEETTAYAIAARLPVSYVVLDTARECAEPVPQLHRRREHRGDILVAVPSSVGSVHPPR